MTEIGKKLKVSRAAAPRVRGLLRGISLPSGGRVGIGSGEGAQPPPQKILEICA